MPIKRQIIRDHSAEANLVARRSFIAMVITVFIMIVMIWNLYTLQVEQFSDFQTRSNSNRIKVLPVAPNRGLIYDRNGVLLADNKPVFSLELVPEEIKDIDATVLSLKEIIDISDDDIEQFNNARKGQRRFKPIALKTQLNENEVAVFSVNRHLFSGVTIEARLARHYPFGSLTTHALGYVAKINKKDLQKLQEAGLEDTYAATYNIGKLGVERYYESLLHGEVGFQQVEVNSASRIIRTLNIESPAPGQDIYLNLDIRLQQRAAELLKGRRGTVIMSDTETGGILALYSNPSYDPNLFVHGISRKDYGSLINSADRPLINRATQGQYPPASTVKPHLALIGLERDIITVNDTMNDRGKYQLPNIDHIWRDWKKGGHGEVNVIKAIEVSCDTFFYDLAYNTGIDVISSSMMEFGFGDYTGIDLYEESSATMPSRGWKRARFDQPWYIGDTIPVGIGQSYWTATPVQLLSSINTLINDGQRVIPQLLRGQLINQELVFEEPKSLRPVAVAQQQNWQVVKDAMYGTVNKKHGTARTAFFNTEYISAGKTGTAQLFSVAQDEKYVEEDVSERLRDNAMYVGYAPFDNPKVSIVVVLENAGGGSSNAAPFARQMLDSYFEYVDETPKTETARILR